MTKKHFIQLADDIKWHNSRYPRDKFSYEQLQTLATFCKYQGPNFNKERWLGYIAGENGPNGGKV